MPDTRKTPSLNVPNGWRPGQGGLLTWFWPPGNKREYVQLSARYWKMHYTVNGRSSGKVTTWHMTFEEVAADYSAVGHGGRQNRPALHWEYSAASDSYVCKGWKNGRPFALDGPTTAVQETITVAAGSSASTKMSPPPKTPSMQELVRISNVEFGRTK